MPRLAEKVGVVGFSRVLGSGALVLASALLARRLEPAAYGTFQQVWLVLTVGTTLLLCGMPLAVFTLLPGQTREERKGFARLLVPLLLAVGAAGAMLIWRLSGTIARAFDNADLARFLPIVALYFVAILPATPLESFLIAENRHVRLARVTLAAALAFLAATLAPPLIGLDAAWIYWGLCAAAAVRTGLLLRAIAGEYGAHAARLAPGLPRTLLAAAAPLGANEAVRVASAWLDKTIVAARFDPETFAIFANGAMEIPLVSILLASVTSVLLPEFARLRHAGDREPILALWRRSMLRTGLLLVPLCAFGLVFAREIMVVLYSERYAASAAPFRIYLLLLPLRAAAYTPILLALGRARTVVVGAVGDLAVSLGLALFLLPRIGYVGPAVAMVVSTYLQALFYLDDTGRALDVPLARLFPWRGVGRLLAAAFVPAAPLALLLLAPLPPLARLALAAPAYALLLWIVAQTRLMPPAEREFLAEIVALGRTRLSARRGPA
jgi:O-antigen/teichoic acid export membrane protein